MCFCGFPSTCVCLFSLFCYGFCLCLGEHFLGLVLWWLSLQIFSQKGGEKVLSEKGCDAVSDVCCFRYCLEVSKKMSWRMVFVFCVTCVLSYEHSCDLCSELPGLTDWLWLSFILCQLLTGDCCESMGAFFSYATIGLLWEDRLFFSGGVFYISPEKIPSLRGSVSHLLPHVHNMTDRSFVAEVLAASKMSYAMS